LWGLSLSGVLRSFPPCGKNDTIRYMKKFLACAFLAGIISGFSAPSFTFATVCAGDEKVCGETCIKKDANCLNLQYPKFPGAPDINTQQGLASIVAWLYVFFVGISGLAAFVMIVWGGVQWMSSQGNPSATGDAKDKIQKALLGLLLVLASFLILQIINPELTLLKDPFQ
jgi:hypothetical protein